jgi:hypothetical protein
VPSIEISKRAVVVGVARGGGPKLLEARVVPGVVFYACLVTSGVGLAYVSALAWVFGCIGWRAMRRRPVPFILVLAAMGVTVRTAVAMATGSTFVYFAQPILLTVVTAGVFLVSLVVGRPVIERIADDFWPITSEMSENPRVQSLFRGLTVLWAGVNLVIATLTFVLLVSLPLATFVAVKQVAALAINVTAVTVTIVWSHRTACREGLAHAPVVVT